VKGVPIRLSDTQYALSKSISVYVFCFKELLVILFLVIMVVHSALKIGMTAGAALTVLCILKEPGGTRAVISPT